MYKCGCSKTFGELIDHFIIGGDEIFVMASKHGVVRIIGAAFCKKHESKIQDCRDSITMFRTGKADGDTGPTVFLKKGKRVRSGFNNDFLLKYGAKPGLKIMANKKCFYGNRNMVKMSPELLDGYRKISKYVHANPYWWLLEIVDGFGAHMD